MKDMQRFGYPIFIVFMAALPHLLDSRWQAVAITFLIFATAMLLMALGVILAGRRLKGSCGGTGTDCSCDDEKQKECAASKQAA